MASKHYHNASLYVVCEQLSFMRRGGFCIRIPESGHPNVCGPSQPAGAKTAQNYEWSYFVLRIHGNGRQSCSPSNWLGLSRTTPAGRALQPVLVGNMCDQRTAVGVLAAASCVRGTCRLWGGMEFVQAVAQFFDSALYYAKVGYESTRKAEVTHVLTAP